MQQPHEPTDEQRRLVKTLSGIGVPQDDICALVGVSKPTLHKHYRSELDVGLAEANAKIAETLFKQATTGNTTAAIFWAKSRMGWREKQDVQVTGANEGPVVLQILTGVPRADD
jgi:hypothetical protein